MAVFNATSQFWFHHMLIMYVVEFMEVILFSSKSCKISSPQKPTICMLTAKKHSESELSFLEWSGAA